MTSAVAERVLSVQDLCVDFVSGGEAVHAVDHVSFDVRQGEVMGLVGESGSGKSTIARAIIGLLRAPGRVVGGRILVDGEDLLGLSERAWRDVRGRKVAMVFQDSLSALNPSMRVGDQVAEAFTVHGASRSAARRRAIELLELVGIPGAKARADHYPHEFSGGMRQRVVIAAALANSPDLLVADEPTSALDVTVQAQILQLIGRLRDELGVATLFITHDLGVVAELCDRVTVLRDGVVVEQGTAADVLTRPTHDYTKLLLQSVPGLEGSADTAPSSPARSEAEVGLEVSELRVNVAELSTLFSKRRPVFAVDGVSLTLQPGETLGLVGESGCGKSTLTRAIAGLARAHDGAVRIGGDDVVRLPAGHLRRRAVQYVFQDPYSSLNPLRTVRQSIEEARLGRAGLAIEELMDRVKLDRSMLERYPAALSGGQRQRIGIARALAAEADYLLCDEPVSALDVSIQAKIIDLLAELRDSLGIGILFIAHDLSVVRQISDRVAVMFLGRIVETGRVADIFDDPQHPYTAALLSAIPELAPHAAREKIVLSGDPPAPGTSVRGCRFASRCPIGPVHRPNRERCHEVDPTLTGSGSHLVACHFPGELSVRRVGEQMSIGAEAPHPG